MKILILILIYIPYATTAQKTAQEYYELAEKKDVGDKLKQAYKYYYKAAELSRNYLYYVKAAEAYYLSHNMNNEKNKKQVESLYNKSMSLKHSNSEGLLSRAKYWEYSANYKQALINLDSLLTRYPDNRDGYLLKARIYMGKKDTLTGFKIYDLAIKNTPKSDWKSIYMDKGFYCYSKGFWKESVDSYLKALELSDKLTFPFYCHLSSSYYNLGERERACYYFDLCEVKKWPSLKSKDELLLNCK